MVEPHHSVEVDRGDKDELLQVRMDLLHGANFNDPAPWAPLLPMRMVVSALGYR